VLSIQPKTNTVVVGNAEQLTVSVVHCERPVWTVDEPAAPFECTVQLRAHGMLSPARIERGNQLSDQLTAFLHTPQRGIAAGQALVMYDGDRVIGSATITATEREAVGSR
jgi:tRNA-specific 2-thiouridylase